MADARQRCAPAACYPNSKPKNNKIKEKKRKATQRTTLKVAQIIKSDKDKLKHKEKTFFGQIATPTMKSQAIEQIGDLKLKREG